MTCKLIIEYYYRDVVSAIVESSKWKSAFLHERETTFGPRTTPMRTLIRKFPGITLFATLNIFHAT